MGTIFVLSHQPFDELPMPDLYGLDKLLHLIAYSVLGLTLLWSRCPGQVERPWRGALWAFLFCLLYGLSDEYHQSFIPNRMVSGWDVAADAAGGLVAGGLWLLKAELREYFCWLHRYLERRFGVGQGRA